MRTLKTLVFICIATSVSAQVSFSNLDRSIIEFRLHLTKTKNAERQQQLQDMFREVGCGENIADQKVRGSKLPNVICTLPGLTQSIIIVGAHFDQVSVGSGIVDNWSGASLLPSLYQSLKDHPRHHTFVFIGFTDEEAGLIGSKYYAGQLSKDEVAKIHAMVNMDTMGLSPTKVWISHADKKLTNAIGLVAQSMSLPVQAMNVEKVGTTDSESFAGKKIPSITLHSLTQETLPILHTAKDQITAMKMDDYYSSYRLIAGYLAYLDQLLAKP